MTEGSDDHKLARDMIDIHRREVPAVAQGNVQPQRPPWSSNTGEVVDPSARNYPAAAGWQGICYRIHCRVGHWQSEDLTVMCIAAVPLNGCGSSAIEAGRSPLTNTGRMTCRD
jgi:hypothetical protein